MKKFLVVALTALSSLSAGKKIKLPTAPPSSLDAYISEALGRYTAAGNDNGDPGSLWSPSSRLQDVTRDLKATQIDDIVTVLVSESDSAVSTGTTKTARASAAQNSITALAGKTRIAGPWANLATLGGSTTLNGTGTTSRTTTLNTT